MGITVMRQRITVIAAVMMQDLGRNASEATQSVGSQKGGLDGAFTVGRQRIVFDRAPINNPPVF